MKPCLLDTSAISDLIRPLAKSDETVRHHAAAYLTEHGEFSISELSCYEIRRGLLKKQAHRQLAHFHDFCQRADRRQVTAEVLEVAAAYWAASQRKGLSIDDCDLIIAATTTIHGMGIVTANPRDFDWIDTLAVFNWRGK